MGGIKTVLIGCGYWGEKYLQLLTSSPEFELLGVADTDPAKLAALRERYPRLYLSEKTAELWRKTRPQAAVIAAPARHHYRSALYLLRRGAWVLLEKPLTDKLKTARLLLKEAESRGWRLFPAMIYAFHPLAKFLTPGKLRELLGAVHYGSFTRTGLGPVRDDVSPLWDLTVHDLTLLSLFKGGAMPSEKYAVPLDPGSSQLVLRYPDGGRFDFLASWSSAYRERKMVLQGEKGTLVYDEVNLPQRLSFYPGGLKDCLLSGGGRMDTAPQLLKLIWHSPLEVMLGGFAYTLKNQKKSPTLDLSFQVLDIFNRLKAKKGF